MAARAQAASLVAVAILAAAAVLGTASGASYTVGEPGGSWDLSTNLTAWASSIVFHLDDQLVFKYNASAHDVVEVTQAGFTSCSAASPVVAARQTGSDAVKLYGGGRRFFICGNPVHCDAGMKLEVKVMLPVCTNDSSGFTMCHVNVPPAGAAPGSSAVPPAGAAPGSSASLGSLLVTTVASLLLLLGLTIV